MVNWESLSLSLLLNSVFSFVAGLLIVWACLKIFRVERSRWKLFLLTLPFLKIIWDLSRGIPDSSVLYTNLDVLNLPENHRALLLGAGFSYFIPLFNVAFAVSDLWGNQFSITPPDFLSAWIAKSYSPLAIPLLLMGLVSVSGTLLFVRLHNYYRFEKERRADRKLPETRSLEKIDFGLREVDLYVSSHFKGSPFAGGVLKPFICFPATTYARLRENERKAVIAHELSHIRSLDLPITLAVKILGDLFWFVPGYKILSNKIDRLREVLADRAAVRRGASGVCLAQALIKMKECQIDLKHSVLYSAFFRERSLLKSRVNILLNEEKDEKPSRFGWRNPYFRFLIAAWTTGCVMMTTFGGHHQIKPVPDAIERIIQSLGLN